MIVGIPKELFPGERRVALIPASVPVLGKAGCSVLVESGAGVLAGFTDDMYREKGAAIAGDRAEVFRDADAIFQLVGPGANPPCGADDLARLRQGQVLVGFLRPLGDPEALQALAGTGATAFAIEMMPRSTRAQSMDALSSMATVAGYKAVLLAADALPKMFPMMMTAAGTISPARVLIVGAGVSGLQAIATAKRLGAVVSAYDIRAAVKEQVQSLGAKFVELDLASDDAEDRGGYARAQDEVFYSKQRALMAKVVAESDVVITTANVPGRRAPVLVTAEMVEGMRPGSVVVDLAAERGGNCELTVAGQTTLAHGVQILAPINLAGLVPFHASQMYSSNISTFFSHLVKDGALQLNLDDEITRATLVAQNGTVVHPQVREALGLPSSCEPERAA